MSASQSLCVDGSQPTVLDVITVPLIGPAPCDYQPENYHIDPATRWVKTGRMGKDLSANVEAPDYRLDRWTGDVPPGEAEANPIDVFLDRDLRIRAAALPNLATNGVPEWWLAGYGWTNAFSAAALDDPDGDGMETWKEYHADTVPTQALSVLRITGLTYAADTLRLEWTGGIQAWQSVEACTNLLAPAWEVVWSNAAPNTEENSLVHPDLPAPATFFRLRSGR